MVYGDYYAHYGAFAAVFLGLAMSGTVARLIPVRETSTSLSRTPPKAAALATTGVVAAVVLLVGYGVHNVRARAESWTVSPQSLAQIAAIAPGACIESDDVSILLLSGRFGAEDPACDRMVDSFGTELALTDGRIGRFETSSAVQRVWLDWAERADAIALSEPDLSKAATENGWSQALQQYLRAHFALVNRSGTMSFYRRIAACGMESLGR